MEKVRVSYIGSGLLAVIAVIIMIIKPFSGDLGDTAHILLGGVIITLGIWIFKPFNLPFSAGGLFLACLALALGLKPAVVFTGFTQSAVWTLIPALFFGYTLQKTGLGKRIALAIIKLFRPTIASLVLAWVLIGVILSVFTPSISVRVAIIIPIAVQCCELCNLKRGSKGNSLILLTAFAMALLPGSGWLSGSLWGPIISGMINALPESQGLVTFDSWLRVFFLPMILTSVLLIVGSLLVLRPKDKLPKDSIDAIKKLPAQKMSRDEIVTGVILAAVFVLFITGRIHGIPDAAMCIAAVFAFFLFGVMETKDISTGASWDLVIFAAIALSLGSVFSEAGITQWLSGIVVPALAPIAGNPWVFMYGVTIFMFIWRFFDVAVFVPTVAIMSPILPAIQEAYGISPLLWIAIFVMPANCFFMTYQNLWAMMTRSIAGDRAWDNKHLSIYGVIYFIACMIALAVAIPMWISAGLFGK